MLVWGGLVELDLRELVLQLPVLAVPLHLAQAGQCLLQSKNGIILNPCIFIVIFISETDT